MRLWTCCALLRENTESIGQRWIAGLLVAEVKTTKMIRRLLALGCLALAGCAAAQQLHFHGYTPASLKEVVPTGSAPARGSAVYVDRVLGGPYPERPRQFSKAVWHSSYYGGIGSSLYEGFHRLPVDDIDAFV